MTNRKDQLRSLFGVQPPEVKGAASGADQAGKQPPAPAAPAPPARRSASGAVKAMGLSLGALGQEVEDARRLRESLAAAERVVELDPAQIDASPFADRLDARGDERFEALKRSMAEAGQQVPVLVRPHPDAARAGRYQAAYGHRRIEAARQLGRSVRAVVRPLSDVELVTAQGNENAERRDLSHIERAMFADLLVRRGFARSVVMAALSVDKTELSRLLQVAASVPRDVAAAIGPAPKAGRARWLQIGALLGQEAKLVIAREAIAAPDFAEAATSDERFQRLYDRLTQRAPAAAQAAQIESQRGARIAEMRRKAGGAVLVIRPDAGAGFADYLAAELPRLHADFERRRAEGAGGAAPQAGEGGADTKD